MSINKTIVHPQKKKESESMGTTSSTRTVYKYKSDDDEDEGEKKVVVHSVTRHEGPLWFGMMGPHEVIIYQSLKDREKYMIKMTKNSSIVAESIKKEGDDVTFKNKKNESTFVVRLESPGYDNLIKVVSKDKVIAVVEKDIDELDEEYNCF